MDQPAEGEFAWIENIRKKFLPLLPPGVEGIGDDCAVIPCGDGRATVVSTDLLIEGQHFLREKISPFELGRKSLAVNLSDIAAMGAEPCGSFLSVGLPASFGPGPREAFLEGYRELSARYGVPLLGGDTTASDRVVVNVTVLGRVVEGRIKRRSGARPGDVIGVSGRLGDSGAGLRALLEGRDLSGESEKELVRRHHNPEPHVRQGIWLGGRESVRAMMDVSDGVASDLLHLLRASGVGAAVDTEALPIGAELTEVADRYGWDPVELALTGGEDYVLLFTADAEGFEAQREAFRKAFEGEDLFPIGTITEGMPKIRWRRQGRDLGVEYRGFVHF